MKNERKTEVLNKFIQRKSLFFLLPALFINIFVMIGPALATFFLAFTQWNGLTKLSFIGLRNYFDIFHNISFFQSILNNIKWTAFFLIVPMMLGLIAATELSKISFLKGMYKVIFILPMMFPKVITARLWQMLFFNGRIGILHWLSQHGLTFLDYDLLGHTSTALWAVAFIDNWQWWGFLAVVFSTAIDQIDKNYYEVAKLEGASGIQIFFKVILPMIRPTVLFMSIMTIIWSFLVFNFIFIVTQGGPAGSTEVLATLSYKTAFYQFEFGKASAVSSIMSLLAGTAIIYYIWIKGKGE